MNDWLCGADLGFWLARLEGIFGVVVVVTLTKGSWRERIKEDWATVASFLALAGFLATLPLAAHVVFDGPDLCRIEEPGELREAIGFYILSSLMVLGALCTPRIISPRNPLQTPWGHPPAWLKFGVILSGWLAIGGIIWGSVYTGGVFSTRVATIWAVSVLGVLLLGIGRMIDLFVKDPWPRIPVVILAAPALTYGTAHMLLIDRLPALQPDKLADPTQKAAPAAIADDWYAAALARLEDIPTDGPVILVAASGGGSRAATFGTLVLETLSQPKDSLFAYANATTTVPATYNHPIADYVWLLSSVSGGSVAVAHHVASHYGSGGRGRIGAPGRMINGYPSAFAPKGGLNASRELTASLLETHELDDVLADFNAPALRGMLSPFSSRGGTLAAFWNTQYGWEESFRAASARSRPLVVFNATLADSGRRLLIGEPPIPQQLLSSWEESHPADIPTKAISRVTPISLDAISRAQHPTVGTAVRMSASFPWGMDMASVASVDGPEQPGREALTQRDLVVGDGGMVDNTGTASIMDILRGIQAESVRNPHASEIMHELEERGVLVIEIDSGAKPVPARGALAKALEPLLGPADALSHADYTRERMAVLLRRKSLGQMVERSTWAAFAYCPKDAQDIITTAWALGPQEKTTLMQQFSDRTLSGNCFADPSDAGDPTLHASPLNAIATAFQPDHVQPLADLAVLDTLKPGDPNAGPIAWTLMDRALRYFDAAGAHLTAVSVFGARAPGLEAFVETESALRGAERVADTGIVTLGLESRLSGWIAGRRYAPNEAGDVTLLWSKIDIPAAAGIDGSLIGEKVVLTRRITVHDGFPDGPSFLPVALATDRSQVTVEGFQTVNVGKDRWDYLAVSWSPSDSLALTCPGDRAEISWCSSGGEQAHQAALTLARAIDDSHELATAGAAGCVEVRETGAQAFLAPALLQTPPTGTQAEQLGAIVVSTLGERANSTRWARARSADGYALHVCL